MSAEAVSDFIDQLKAVTWSGSDDDLAKVLCIGKSTIASWRRRGSLPTKVQREIFIKYGVDYCLIDTGQPCELAQNDHLFDTTFYAAILKIGSQLSTDEIESAASWLTNNEVRFRAHILDGAVFNVPDPFRTTAYKRVLKSILQGDLATLSNFRALQAELRSEAGDDGDGSEFPT